MGLVGCRYCRPKVYDIDGHAPWPSYFLLYYEVLVCVCVCVCLLLWRAWRVNVRCSVYFCFCVGVGGMVMGCMVCDFGLDMS